MGFCVYFEFCVVYSIDDIELFECVISWISDGYVGIIDMLVWIDFDQCYFMFLFMYL